MFVKANSLFLFCSVGKALKISKMKDETVVYVI